MAQANRTAKSGTGRNGRPPRSKPGVKRERILEVAIDAFGRYGYEDAKWADVAAAVGIGPTALYHYFESKQHCLYEIMGTAVADFQARFDRITAAHDDWTEALVELLVDAFSLSDQEVQRNRVLMAEPRARHAAGPHPRERPAAPRAGRARALQQRVALVPAGRHAAARRRRTVLRQPPTRRARLLTRPRGREVPLLS